MGDKRPQKPERQDLLRQLNHDVGACALLCLLSIPGVVLSVFLTLVKFRSDYRCDYAMLSACSIGQWFDCNHVLSSDASIVLKLPISAYSTGYYLAVFGLAVAALWRPRMLPVLRPLLLWLGWIGLLVVLGLASYTVFVLREGCSYCFIIYSLTAAIFLTTALMHPQGHWQGLRALLVPWRPRQGGVLLLTGLAFLALISVQMVQYRRAANIVFDSKCLVSNMVLPETHLRTQAPRITAQISLFVDFSCHHCRREFEFWRDFVAANPDEYVFEVYHFARDGECMREADRGFSNQATRNYSCLAAQAAECAEKLRPGTGMAMVSALFNLQDRGSPPYFTELSIGEAASSVGFEAIPKENFEHPFYTCVREDKQVITHIAGHTRYILENGIVDPPVTYITSYDADGQALPRLVQSQGAKQHASPLKTLQVARKAAMPGDSSAAPAE
ncbi:MAG TPA: vitamin K epoxide reductase family protein [Nannocystis sp.]|jgi:uncharacterized membrane protein